MPPPASRTAPPLDEAGAGEGWIVLKFFLHAVAGVFSGRVLLLAASGLIVSEAGFAVLVGYLSGVPAAWDAAGPPTTSGEGVASLVRDAWDAQQRAALLLAEPFGVALTPPPFGLAGLAGGVWRLAVWSLFGVAIARVAATHLACHDRPPWRAALRWARGGWAGQLLGPLAIVALAAFAAGGVWALGWASRMDALGVLVALVWPLVILLGTVGALLAIGFAVGTPLMWAAQAVEEPDPFDAASRGLAYAYQRPLRLVAYVAQAWAVGAAAGAVVLFVVETTSVWLAGWFAGVGYDPGASTGGWAETIALFWLRLFFHTPTLFHTAYFWFAVTAVYLLLRRDIDEKPCDEIYVAPASVSSEEAAA